MGAPTRDVLLDDPEWDEITVAHDLAGADLEQVQMRAVRCTSAQFTGADLQRARMVDVVFERCELSGVRFDESSLTRVEFRDCRMSGTQFNACRMADVRVIGCRLDGSSFRMATGERVWFVDSVLARAELRAAELKWARFERCELEGADFTQARIPDASLHGSRLDGLRGVDGLQRPVIEAAQVMSLAWSLLAVHGVVVEGLDDDG
jgi:uncharacterized protein YjbI with pentapeptide repeats